MLGDSVSEQPSLTLHSTSSSPHTRAPTNTPTYRRVPEWRPSYVFDSITEHSFSTIASECNKILNGPSIPSFRIEVQTQPRRKNTHILLCPHHHTHLVHSTASQIASQWKTLDRPDDRQESLVIHDFERNALGDSVMCLHCGIDFVGDSVMFACQKLFPREHYAGFHLCERCHNQTLYLIQQQENLEKLSDSMIDNHMYDFQNDPVFYERRDFSFNHGFDFSFVPKHAPRLVVLGESGLGKSMLLNKIAGRRYHFSRLESKNEDSDDEDYSLELMAPDGEIFETGGYSHHGVTRQTGWSNVNFLNDSTRPLIVIDTPGVFEVDTETEAKQAAELAEKLRNMQFVHTILILLPKTMLSGGARILEPDLRLLISIEEMFNEQSSDSSKFWNHVIIAFARCDEHDRDWRNGHKRKIANFKEALRKRFSLERDIPILTLSSVQLENDSKNWSRQKQFEKLWDFVSSRENDPFDTSNVKMRDDWRQLLIEKKRLEYRYKLKEDIQNVHKKVFENQRRLGTKVHQARLKNAYGIPENPITGVIWGAGTAVAGAIGTAVLPVAGPLMMAREGCPTEHLWVGGGLASVPAAAGVTVGASLWQVKRGFENGIERMRKRNGSRSFQERQRWSEEKKGYDDGIEYVDNKLFEDDNVKRHSMSDLDRRHQRLRELS